VKLPDDGPCETETCSREVKVDHKNIEPGIFVVVTVILTLLHIVIHNTMHTVKIEFMKYAVQIG
jgi:hypothetical protein